MDFDGQISKEDLRVFLGQIMHVDPFELTDLNINRLYKLLDLHKRSKIMMPEFI